MKRSHAFFSTRLKRYQRYAALNILLNQDRSKLCDTFKVIMQVNEMLSSDIRLARSRECKTRRSPAAKERRFVHHTIHYDN